MPKTAISPQERLLSLLRTVRGEAGLTQSEVAQALGQPQSFVSKYESGEPRLDVLELRDVCRATGLTLADFVKRLEQDLR